MRPEQLDGGRHDRAVFVSGGRVHIRWWSGMHRVRYVFLHAVPGVRLHPYSEHRMRGLQRLLKHFSVAVPNVCLHSYSEHRMRGLQHVRRQSVPSVILRGNAETGCRLRGL